MLGNFWRYSIRLLRGFHIDFKTLQDPLSRHVSTRLFFRNFVGNYLNLTIVDSLQTEADAPDAADAAEVADAVEVAEAPVTEAAVVEAVAKKAAPSEIEALLRKLKKLVASAEKGLVSSDEGIGASSANFLTFLFSNHKKFANYLPMAMRIGAWNAYRSSVLPQRWQDRLVENLVSSAREKELMPMVNAVLQDLQDVSNRIG